MYEAQQAYYYGLPENLAISSVTSNAAIAIGLDHRVGYVKEGKLFLVIDLFMLSYASRIRCW